MEANYFTILWWFLPYIHMNQSWVYMCSPTWTPLPSPFPSHPSGSSQCISPELPVSCIEPGLVIYFTYDNMHVSMLFSQIIPPLPSTTESKSLFFTSVSLSLSCIQGHHYHLSQFHMYSVNTLYWCFSFWLTSLCIIGSSFNAAYCFAGDIKYICEKIPWRREWLATHSSILAWRTAWIEESGGL